jgi:GNAT superfamily N-acetyltransferase
MDYRITIPAEPSAEDRLAVLGPLSDFNDRNGFPSDMLPVAVLLTGEDGATAGGLWGKTGYGWLFVEFLAVPDEARGRNLGAALMGEAERIALDRGCAGAWLTTFSFQARGFYEKLGYSVFGTLEDSPAGNDRIFMRKRLKA